MDNKYPDYKGVQIFLWYAAKQSFTPIFIIEALLKCFALLPKYNRFNAPYSEYT